MAKTGVIIAYVRAWVNFPNLFVYSKLLKQRESAFWVANSRANEITRHAHAHTYYVFVHTHRHRHTQR